LYAFAHIDKTAGRTVRAVLRRSFGAGHCEIRTPYARRPADRNDRSVFVTGDDLRRVRRIYRGLRGIAGHNFVGLTDAFDESLLMLGQWLGEPDFRPEYRPVNRLADKQRARDAARARADLGYLEAPDVRARLREVNALDQQVYDFAVRELFARQRQAYVGDLAADVAALRVHNQQVSDWSEPLSGRLLRNWVYKPALVLGLA